MQKRMRKLISGRAVLGGLSFMVAAGFWTTNAPLAQTAQDAELSYITHKYQVATFGELANKKCGGLTNAGKSAAKHARVRYYDEMKAAGQVDAAIAYEKGIVSGLAKTNCQNLYKDTQVVSTMNEVTGLVDEYHLAILRSGVSECGDFNAEATGKVMQRGREAELRLKTRPDYASVNAFASAAGQEFSEICVNPVVSDTFLMMQYPVGNVFVYSAQE